jgi:O-antigen ligase
VTEPLQGASPSAPGNPSYLIPLALVPLLILFPPETRGESMAGCALLIGLFALLSARRLAEPGRVTPLLLLLAAVFPLTLTAISPGAAVEPLAIVYLAGVLALCAAGLPEEVRRGHGLPRVLALAATLVAIHGLYQYIWGLDALAEELAAAGVAGQEAVLGRVRSGRAFAAFATPAAMGAALGIGLPVTVGLALKETARPRLLLIVAAVIQTAGLFAAASATALTALAAALGLGALTNPRSRRVAALGIPVLLIGLVAVVGIRGRQVVDLNDAESPFRLRASNYVLAASMAADHPWVGVGPGGFGESYPGYRRAGDNETRHVHDLPLELTAELGFVAGGIVSVLFYLWFLGPLRRLSGGPPWQAGLALGLAAFALQNLADFTAFFPSLLWLAAICRGWLQPEPVPGTRPLAVIAPAVALLGSLLAAAVLLPAGLAANHGLAAASAAREGDWPRVESLAARATALAPWRIEGWVLRVHSRLDGPGVASDEELQQARDWLDRGIRLYPVRPSARHLRARVRLALGDPSGAWSDAVQAARLYPLRREYAESRDRLGELLRSREGRP